MDESLHEFGVTNFFVTHHHDTLCGNKYTQDFCCQVRRHTSVNVASMTMTLRHRAQQAPAYYLPHMKDASRRQPITHNKALTSGLTWQLSRNSCVVLAGHTTAEWRNSAQCVSVRVRASASGTACMCVFLGESRSELRLYRTGSTDVVGVGEMNHMV